MKTLLLSVLCSIFAFSVQAQNNNNVRAVEFEVGAGVIQGLNYQGNRAAFSGQLLTELRLNHTPTPFDVGMQFSLTVFDRRNEPYLMTNTIRHRSLVTFVDYNLRRWRHCSAFVGVGIGMSFVNNSYDYDKDTGRDDDTVFDRA